MIPIVGFMYLDNKLTLNLNWYSISLQPCTNVFWATKVTKLVYFPPKCGLVLQKMVRLDWKINHDSHPSLHETS